MVANIFYYPSVKVWDKRNTRFHILRAFVLSQSALFKVCLLYECVATSSKCTLCYIYTTSVPYCESNYNKTSSRADLSLKAKDAIHFENFLVQFLSEVMTELSKRCHLKNVRNIVVVNSLVLQLFSLET